MQHSVTCPHCNQQADISHEKTVFLRQLLDHGAIHEDNYQPLVKQFDLPDPDRLRQKKQFELLEQICSLRQKMSACNDEEEEALLQSKLEKADQEYRTLMRS